MTDPCDRLARAIHAALEEDDPDALVCVYEEGERIAIDGRFDLVRVARRVLEILAETPP